MKQFKQKIKRGHSFYKVILILVHICPNRETSHVEKELKRYLSSLVSAQITEAEENQN